MKKLSPTILLLLALAALLAGCTSPGDRYSSMPQDRPANWEGEGAMGGMTPSPGSGVR
jgi:hypothetical protein